jgi:hypothetical protein
MEYHEIVEYLGYAAGHDLQVRIVTRDGTELIGVPSSVDTHLTAHEVYVRPRGLEDTEIGLNLSHVTKVELV